MNIKIAPRPLAEPLEPRRLLSAGFGGGFGDPAPPGGGDGGSDDLKSAVEIYFARIDENGEQGRTLNDHSVLMEEEAGDDPGKRKIGLFAARAGGPDSDDDGEAEEVRVKIRLVQAGDDEAVVGEVMAQQGQDYSGGIGGELVIEAGEEQSDPTVLTINDDDVAEKDSDDADQAETEYIHVVVTGAYDEDTNPDSNYVTGNGEAKVGIRDEARYYYGEWQRTERIDYTAPQLAGEDSEGRKIYKTRGDRWMGQGWDDYSRKFGEPATINKSFTSSESVSYGVGGNFGIDLKPLGVGASFGGSGSRTTTSTDGTGTNFNKSYPDEPDEDKKYYIAATMRFDEFVQIEEERTMPDGDTGYLLNYFTLADTEHVRIGEVHELQRFLRDPDAKGDLATAQPEEPNRPDVDRYHMIPSGIKKDDVIDYDYYDLPVGWDGVISDAISSNDEEDEHRDFFA